MPASLTHLLVGREALTAGLFAWEPEPSQYYLGCVLPDAPNLSGPAEKAVRWAAHLRDKDLDCWVDNAARFFQHCPPEKRSLALGYAVHLVSDAVWDQRFEKGLRKAVGGKTPDEIYRRRWNEHRRFEAELEKAPWWRDEVRPLLEKAHPQGIGTISDGLAGRWLSAFLAEYRPAPVGKTVGYVSAELAAEFSARVRKRLCKAGIAP